MTVAFWTLLVAIVFPWLMAFIKKSSLASNGAYNNSAPRAQSEKLHGVSRRALWAEQNSFELKIPLIIDNVILPVPINPKCI